jgi:hypothetical protein
LGFQAPKITFDIEQSTVTSSFSDMAGVTMLSLVASMALLAQPSMQAQDPMRDFCRRFGHQTAVIDNK